MHPVLISVNEELALLSAGLKTTLPNNEPLCNAHGVWHLPGITRDELIQEVEIVRTLLVERGADESFPDEALIADYQRRLSFMRINTLPHIWGGNGGQAVTVLLITLDRLRKALEKALPETLNQAKDLANKLSIDISNAKAAATRLRSLEARIGSIEARSTSLDDMVTRIERAHTAADQLPVDLESLHEARDTINRLLDEVSFDRQAIGKFCLEANADRASLTAKVEEAENIVSRCGAAYAASTSHGLAAAFTERSRALGSSMWVWVGGLIVALGLGSWIGSTQLNKFTTAISQPDTNSAIAMVNFVLALLSVGATVWFSWLATKQVGQRFRLAEDYAFKASVSRAYEGYRREAASIDEEFVSRLFSSALSRLDEQPLRLVETSTHGSPWHELASSEVVRKAAESVPEFATAVTQLAKDGLANMKQSGLGAISSKTSAGDK
jgi:hypothetical protein